MKSLRYYLCATMSHTHSPDSEFQSPPAIPDIQDASAPFDDVRADIILRSCDGIDFRVFKNILSVASPVFADMFDLSHPPSANNTRETRHGLPVFVLSEDARTLDRLLRFCYPVRSPQLKNLGDIRLLLEAIRKYCMDVFDDHLNHALSEAIDRDPVAVFAIASRFELGDIATKAALRTVWLPFSLLNSPEMKHAPVEHILLLMQFHALCGEAASAVTMRRDWFIKCPLLVEDRRFCDWCCVADASGSSWWGNRTLWIALQKEGQSLSCHPWFNAAKPLIKTGPPCFYCGGPSVTSLAAFKRCFSNAVDKAVATVPVPKF
ncbi:hypothetical protein BV25DRAFT_408442 [Artomyces pyxidatus]|uniref:Uncharacterized protein n=1 Tax=Artomyces pyxidatus TaxID=48021 RepID=A0ACB8T3C9_9AGAM|nr:hypothetical protein BV25DRAFT_408442 [Artomyces pyxidatus]